MNFNLKVMVAVTAAVLLTSISVRAESDTADVRQVSGEIGWIDTKLGKLQLNSDPSQGREEITEYRINQNETRVTDPKDKKFLTVDDLQPGQYITLDVVKGQEEAIVQKITANPRPDAEFQEAFGEIEAINTSGGTLTLAGRSRPGEEGKSYPSYFVFEPEKIVVMQNPSRQPVELVLKPNDVVKVEYAVRDGKQQAQAITLYSPKATSTTTTTTITTSTTQ